MSHSAHIFLKRFIVLLFICYSHFSFAQYCEKIAPFEEPFSSGWQDCWSEIATGSGDAHERGLFKSYAWETAILVSPKLLDLDNNKYIDIEFYMGLSQLEEFEVGTMTNPLDDTTFTAYETINYKNATYIENSKAKVRISFSKYTGNDKFIAFRATRENRRVTIADFIYDAIDHCDYVRELTYSNVTPNSLTLNWLPEASATNGYRVKYDGQTAETTNTNITLSGLTESTSYNFEVTSLCELGESDSRYAKIQTPCSTSFTEYATDFQDAEFTNFECWSERNGSGGEMRFAVDVGRNDSRGVRMTITNGYEDMGGYLISPKFENLDSSKEITFWMRKFYGHSHIEVGTIKNPDDLTSYIPLKVFDSQEIGPGGWQNFSVSFENLVTDHKYIVIHQGNKTRNTNGLILLDDFVYRTRLSCERPQHITMSNTESSNDIEISWDDDGASEWQIEYGGESFELGSGIAQTISNPSFLIPNLQENKSYDAYVRSKCTDGSYSDWSAVFRFYSGCLNSFTSGYTQNFDNGLDTCWNYLEFPQNSRSYYTENTNNYRGDSGQSITLTNGAAYSLKEYNYLISPRFSDMDANKKVSFYLKGLFGDFQVGTMSNPDDESTFNELQSYIRTEGTLWEKKTVQLTDEIGDAKYIAFRFKQEYYSGSETVSIDDFSYEESSDCVPPKDVIITEVTDSSAKISWTPQGNETAWEIAYTYPISLNPNFIKKIVVYEPSYDFEELLSNYTYKFYVSALCDSDGHHLSSEIGPYNFDTDCGNITVNYEQDFNGDGAPSNKITNNRCWSSLVQKEYPGNAWTELSNKYQRESGDDNTIFELESFTDEGVNLIYITPELVDFNNEKLISFDLYVRDSKLNFEIGTMTDPTDIESFEPYTVIAAENMLIDEWKKFTVDFENYTGNAKFLAFRPRKNLNHFLSQYPHNGSISFDNFRYFNDDYAIKGIVRHDAESNGCEADDTPIAKVKITTNNNSTKVSRYTNSVGEFDFYPNEGTYTVSPDNINPYFSFFPDSKEITLDASNTLQKVDFCLKPNGIHSDLQVTILPAREARPGFEAIYTVHYENVGTSSLSGNLNLHFDNSKLNFLNATPVNSNGDNASLSWLFEDLKPFESNSISVKFQVYQPPTVNIGEEIVFTLEGTHSSQEETPEDNTFVLTQTTIGSYDPNDKTVLEGQQIAIADIDNYLHYVVRFQNTGTASAINVRIEDVLDANLDWSTFSPIAMSHDGTVEITDDNHVAFLFNNINLPHEDADAEGSNGYISFKIKPKSDIPVGTIIKGKAAIYFDFNPPIITNEVTTEIVDEIALTIKSVVTTNVSCFGSNDGSVETIIAGGLSPYDYEIFDANTNIALSGSTNNTFDNIPPGSYYIRVTDDNSNQIQSELLTITENPPLTATVSVNSMTCNNYNDASVFVSVSGGNPPYQLSIDNGLTYQDTLGFTNLGAGNYVTTIKDAFNCSYDVPFTISQGHQTNEVINLTHATCDQADGSISIVIENQIEYLFSIESDSETAAFQSSNSFIGLEAGTYTVFIAHESGCTIQKEVIIARSNCPTFSLPVTNFTIETTSETCASSDNGSILIQAEENLEYIAILEGIGISETKTFRTFTNYQNLKAGAYDLCIRVIGEPLYEKCFKVIITEPEELKVDAYIDDTGKSLSLSLSGADMYYITLNGVNYQTTDTQLTLPISEDENIISVKSDFVCQGKFEKTLKSNFHRISIFPNPVISGDLTIEFLNSNESEALLSVFSQNGVLIQEKLKKITNNMTTINMDGMPHGVYTIMVTTATQNSVHKIIKK